MSATDRLNVSFTAAVCIERDGQLLMVQKQDRRWGLPGGHLLKGEGILEAARREAREEAGVCIVPYAILGIYHFPRDDGSSLCIVIRAFISQQASAEAQDAEVRHIEWKDHRAVRALITSDDLYRPEYVAQNLMAWLEDKLIPLDTLQEFPGSWAG